MSSSRYMSDNIGAILNANSHKDAFLAASNNIDSNDGSSSGRKIRHVFSHIIRDMDPETIPLTEFKRALIAHRLGYELLTTIGDCYQDIVIYYMVLIMNLDIIDTLYKFEEYELISSTEYTATFVTRKNKFINMDYDIIINTFSKFMNRDEAESMTEFIELNDYDYVAVPLLTYSTKMVSIITDKMNDSITWKLPSSGNNIINEDNIETPLWLR